MAKRHPNDDRTETNDYQGNGTPTSRRTFMKTVGIAAAFTGVGSVMSGTATAEGIESYLSPSGEVHIPPGEYTWQGSGLSVGSGDALIGDGNPGDVVWQLVDGTMDGNVSGHLENIVVEGANNEPKAGINLYPGASVDGFVWMDGGQQLEDRALYSPDGGSDRVTIRNSAWANMANNGAYIDKPLVTMENCAAVNNNIANVRVGHRDGTPTSGTTYVRNTLIANTSASPPSKEAGGAINTRGLRFRHPGNFVVENCWFVYKDVDGAGDLVEIHDGAAGSSVTLRNCHFYNDSGGKLVRDKSGGNADVVIENCTVEGSGSREVDPSFSGNGFTEGSVDYPLPSELTGRAAADDVAGVGPNVEPWASSDGTNTTTDTTSQNTIVLHADASNPDPVDVSFTTDGPIDYASEAEPGTDTIVDNGDGTFTATSVSLDPDALDSYYFEGSVVDYALPDGYVVDVSVNGTTQTWDELVGTDTTDSTDSTDTGGSGGSDSTDSTDSSGSGGSDSTDSTSGSGTDASDTFPHRISIVGNSTDDVTEYTFTVTGEVIRDEAASQVTADSTPWDRMEDIAQDGKVIGLVGSGVDAYRFHGRVDEITIGGDAVVDIDRNV